jgi:hypothetical protein
MAREITKGDKQTLIEQGTEFTGTMKSTCPVVVNGRVEGELTAPELDVTTTGVVQGNIKADRLSSRGKLSGNIDAGDLFLSGAVGSKTVIKAKNLEVKLAPDQGRMELTFGECTLDVGDEPTKERRTESSAKAVPSMGMALPVTRSEAPSALVPPEAAGVELKPAAKDDKSRGSISNKPPAKKGASDSIPPGAS